jgi:hypothetical protein
MFLFVALRLFTFSALMIPSSRMLRKRRWRGYVLANAARNA